MATSGGADRHPEPASTPHVHRRYSAGYKARILAEYETLDKKGKGALLRREGLYTSLISEWRKQRARGGLEPDQPSRTPSDPIEQELAALRRENQRLAAELAKARRVIDLQTRLSALLDQPDPHNGKPNDTR